MLYGDTYLRIDYAAVERASSASGLPALMTVLRNEGQWDTSNVVLRRRRVGGLRQAPPDARRCAGSTTGSACCAPDALDAAGPDEPDLAGVYHELSRRGELAGYEATERFYEIGTPDALAETDAFLRDSPREPRFSAPRGRSRSGKRGS